VGRSQFTLEAKRIGKFKLTLSARMNGGAHRADIVVREIEVIPNGREQNVVFNGRLESNVRHELNFPAASIADASKIFVRLYPGPLSQVIEGMDSLLRMPGGCFEQTSSSTYPNVLALDYMKRTKKLTPEVHAQSGGIHCQRVSTTVDLRSSRRRILLVRQRACQQDPDGVRTDGVLRHVESPRRGLEINSANTGVVSRAQQGTEAGSRTPRLSMRAQRIATIRMCCASPLTLRGLLGIRDTRGRRSRRPSSLSRAA